MEQTCSWEQSSIHDWPVEKRLNLLLPQVQKLWSIVYAACSHSPDNLVWLPALVDSLPDSSPMFPASTSQIDLGLTLDLVSVTGSAFKESQSNFWLRCEVSQQLNLSSVQLSRVQLFVTPWIATRQASLSITNSRSSLKLMSIESVMPSNHLILCHPLLLLPSVFTSIGVVSNESARRIRWPKIGASASASVLPMNSQDWFPLWLTGLISLQSKEL